MIFQLSFAFTKKKIFFQNIFERRSYREGEKKSTCHVCMQEEKKRETETEKSLICWSTLQMAAMAWAG